MNIMFGESITNEVKEKYTLLELDTFYFTDTGITSTAYCLVESMPIQEMINVEQFVNLHSSLIKNYQLKNWKFCEDALEHLVGKWNGEVDTFYSTISNRIVEYKNQQLDESWNGIIIRP